MSAAIPGRKIELNDLGAARQYFIAANDRGSTQISELCCFRTELAAVAMGEVGLS